MNNPTTHNQNFITEAMAHNPLLAQLLNIPYSGVAVIDKEYAIAYCNPYFEEILGYTNGVLIHHSIQIAISSNHAEEIGKHLAELFSNQEEHINGTIKLLTKNGQALSANYTARKSPLILGQEYAIVYFGLNQEPGVNQKVLGSIPTAILEAIFTITNEPIIITDAKPDGRVPDILYVNEAFSKMSGYSTEECIGNQPSMLTGTETNLSELIRLADHIKNENPGNFELLNYKKDGTQFWVQFSIIPIKNNQGICTHWVAFEKDITEQKHQNQLLKESETKYRSLVQNSSVGIYILDQDGFQFANQKLTELTGYSEIELVNIPLPKLIYHADFLGTNKKIQNHLLGISQENLFEFRIIKKSGEIRWFEATGSRIILNGNPSIIGIINDVTDRRESEEKIRKFSQAIEQSAASIIITNLASEIEYVNPAFVKITGYEMQEIIGQNPRILKTTFNEKNAHQEMWEALNNNESWRGVFYNKRKDGSTFWEQVVISPVFDASGNKTNYVAVKDDITHRVQLENEKEKLIEELTISLNDLKQFSYITSHNLRAPVTNLVGIIDLLDLNRIQDVETLELIEGFKKSTLKLNETLEDLIDTLIIKSNSNVLYKDINFKEVLENTCLGLNNIIKEKNAKIEADFSQAPNYYLVKTYVDSIFQNLISNAIKYAKPDVAPLIKIKSTYIDNKLVLSFSDNGIGMNLEKIKDRLFGLYQKFHANKDSKGIGLFLVKSHVHAMNGNIELTSKLNEGTTFTITFEK